jgi:hypothetical protein
MTKIQGMLGGMHLIARGLAAFGMIFVLSQRLLLADDRLNCPNRAPPVCEEAKVALGIAQTAVQAAAANRALWTTAEDAMKLARAAFVRGDYPEAIHAAQTAAEQAQLGIAQTQYPMFQLPKL